MYLSFEILSVSIFDTIVKIKDKISEVLILRRYLRSGDTYKAEPVKSKIISKYVKDIAKSLNIYGPCNFQLRLDNNGRPKVFEIILISKSLIIFNDFITPWDTPPPAPVINTGITLRSNIYKFLFL